MEKIKVGIIGIGMVGGALRKYFEAKDNYDLRCYDSFKGIGSLERVQEMDYIYLCVPTPHVPGKGCDTSIVESVIESFTVKDKVIIIKSTVLPGTTDMLQSLFPEQRFLFNPEFLTEVTADNDMCFPDRQVMGYTDQSFTAAKDVLLQLPLAPYEKIVPAIVAEMLKYAGNTWFSVKVAKNNELYDLAMKIGFTEDEWEQVVSGLAADKRVERTHLTIVHKGKRGYSGKCLPKDAKGLIEFAKKNGISMPVLEAANDYNDELLRSQGLAEFI